MGHKPMYCDNNDGEYCIETNRVVCCFSSLYSKFSISILQTDVTQERVSYVKSDNVDLTVCINRENHA